MNDETRSVLRGIIFDCDGVLMDSEPLHFAAFREALGDDAHLLTEELYKQDYLPLDDHEVFVRFYQETAKALLSRERLEALKGAKADIFNRLVETEGVLPYPSVPELVIAVAQRYPLAVASGSRRAELELMLASAGIRHHFEVIISADDVERGKPHPESYLKALAALNDSGKRPMPILPAETVVIEDAKDGIGGAHAAGMKCIAVATSYPAFELSKADLVVPTLSALRVSQIEDLFHPPQRTPAPQPN